jgi:hypothetical protein
VLVVASPLEGLPELAGGVDVCRSTRVLGVISAQLFRSSFGETRAGILSLWLHSQRALVSNETH